ncbi:MAG TPA: LysM peptidoglycan-binding domain-containing protein [Thermoleophilaceae bacterium]|nr:LysM peptidoglycan-binding domain-containing protein [Thermoleophilaceae bacterium]
MPRVILATAVALAIGASPAQAYVAHTVAPGETLWSIAAANGMSTSAVAAANGLSPTSNVVLGSTIQIPSASQAATAVQGATAQLSSSTPTAAASAAPPPAGSYVVRAGDSLSAIAARSGVSTSQLAWMNGLDPARVLLSGTVLKLPSETAPAAAASAPAPVPAQRVVPTAAPNPTPGRVSASDIATVASQNGVSSSFAQAIAWQESGFNNGAVSSANARGVMQIMPGTWSWINQSLASRRLDPNSAIDNVQAGALYLRQLLRDTGGDPAAAAAAYYQGLGSVRAHGMLPETQRYVSNVMALRSRFGGP